MHGYAPEDKDSAASWLSNNPHASSVEKLSDIFYVMKEVAEL